VHCFFLKKIQRGIYDYASVLLYIETTGLKCKLEILLIKQVSESLNSGHPCHHDESPSFLCPKILSPTNHA